MLAIADAIRAAVGVPVLEVVFLVLVGLLVVSVRVAVNRLSQDN